MSSFFNKKFVEKSVEEEEQQPILPGKEKTTRSNHFGLKVICGLLAIVVCALVIVTIYQSTQYSAVVSNVENDDTNVDGKLGQSYSQNRNRGSRFNFTRKENSEDPVVKISSGEIRGKVLQSRDGRDYFAFYGIPYAEPPLGNLRFQPPKPYTEKWQGVRDGTQPGGEGAQCMQVTNTAIGATGGGTEDCLKLQVFTPKLPGKWPRRNPKLPVMFYILGGAYIAGRANRYGADYMMDEDIVLVLIDFRYGAFGHLNTEDLEIRGNMGFKDQVMALKWVQENIEKFGGDPKKVLIFGNSSGSSSVHGHIISTMSDGLFSRAVSQSGTVVLPPEFATRPIDSARYLGTQLNCPNVEDTKELHACLIEANATDIAAIHLPDMHFLTKEAIPADGDLSQVFMSDFPINLLKQGKFKKDIPWILGCNSAEYFIPANKMITEMPQALEILDEDWDALAPAILGFKDDNVTHKVAKDMRQFYFGSKPIDKNARWNLTNILSDIKWLHPVKRAADYHALYGGLAYFYFLTHEPVQSYGESAKTGLPPPYGVGHADEVQFFYPFSKFPYISKESKDYNFSKTIIKIWTDFARSGVPRVPNLKEWPPLPLNERDSPAARWLEFNDTSKLIDPLTDRMTFLDSLPFITPELYEPKVTVVVAGGYRLKSILSLDDD